MRAGLRFWVSALAVALLFAAGTRHLLPYQALRMDTEALRLRGWLLTLWTGGILAVCFGLAGLLGVSGPIGVREVAEAGSLDGARDARRASPARGVPYHGNFAWWLVATGALLLVVYFLAWLRGGADF